MQPPSFPGHGGVYTRLFSEAFNDECAMDSNDAMVQPMGSDVELHNVRFEWLSPSNTPAYDLSVFVAGENMGQELLVPPLHQVRAIPGGAKPSLLPLAHKSS